MPLAGGWLGCCSWRWAPSPSRLARRRGASLRAHVRGAARARPQPSAASGRAGERATGCRWAGGRIPGAPGVRGKCMAYRVPSLPRRLLGWLPAPDRRRVFAPRSLRWGWEQAGSRRLGPAGPQPPAGTERSLLPHTDPPAVSAAPTASSLAGAGPPAPLSWLQRPRGAGAALAGRHRSRSPRAEHPSATPLVHACIGCRNPAGRQNSGARAARARGMALTAKRATPTRPPSTPVCRRGGGCLRGGRGNAGSATLL